MYRGKVNQTLKNIKPAISCFIIILRNHKENIYYILFMVAKRDIEVVQSKASVYHQLVHPKFYNLTTFLVQCMSCVVMMLNHRHGIGDNL